MSEDTSFNTPRQNLDHFYTKIHENEEVNGSFSDWYMSQKYISLFFILVFGYF